MIARSSATSGQVRLLRPAVVCYELTQIPERRQRDQALARAAAGASAEGSAKRISLNNSSDSAPMSR